MLPLRHWLGYQEWKQTTRLLPDPIGLGRTREAELPRPLNTLRIMAHSDGGRRRLPVHFGSGRQSAGGSSALCADCCSGRYMTSSRRLTPGRPEARQARVLAR